MTMTSHHEETMLLPRDVSTTAMPPSPSPRWGNRNVVLLTMATATAGVVLFFGSLFEGSVSSRMSPVSVDTSDSVPLLGSKGKHKKKHHDEEDEDEDDGMAYCMDGKYSKRTLQLAYELAFSSLFQDSKGQKKYEASSVIMVNETVYAVCDSSWAISKFGAQLQPFADGNVQVGDPDRNTEEESGYEALFHVDHTFYIVRESIQHEDATYHAIIEELIMDDENEEYSVSQTCSCEYEFEGDSKGFEGAIPIRDLNNELVILGLCEGNHCSESRKNDKGNGRLVVMRKVATPTLDDTSTCNWATIREVKIPPSANFRDYSAITMNDQGRVAISSQEESQVWIGQLMGQDEDGHWDIDAIEFDSEEEAVVYDFPKNDQCVTIYCNVEGIHWVNDETLIAVSDKMKSKGKQDFRCFDKDQSVHVFVLP